MWRPHPHSPSAATPASTNQSLFDDLQATFAQAWRRHPTECHQLFYTFGGKSVRLRIVGEKLGVHTIRSLAHLQRDDSTATEPQLRIDLWDAQETGLPCPAPTSSESIGPTWTVAMRRPIDVTLSHDGRYVRTHHEGCTTWLDRETDYIVGSRAWNDGICLDETAEPFSLCLYTWYADHDIHICHAGSISWNGQGLLLAGPSGSGKTTVALACVSAGFDFLGDDRVGLQSVEDGSFVGHSIYNSAHLEPDYPTHFPALVAHAIPGDRPDDRALIHLSDLFPDRVKRAAPIRALVMPRIVETTHPRIHPASRGEALRALAPSAVLLPFGRRVESFDRLTRLVEQIPVYRLDLTPDLDRIPPLVHQILDEARI